MKTFEKWYQELWELAKAENLLCLITGIADHREGYKAGLTPAEELFSLKYPGSS